MEAYDTLRDVEGETGWDENSMLVIACDFIDKLTKEGKLNVEEFLAFVEERRIEEMSEEASELPEVD